MPSPQVVLLRVRRQ